MNRYTKILVLTATCLGIGYMSGVVTRSNIETWYPMLEKPSFNPPNGIFAPVWTTLYLLMDISGGLVWAKIDENREEVKKALTFFAIQLALNALWSILFFGFKNPMLGMVEIIILALMIYETLYKFLKINKTAGYLLVPYLLWVCFAAVLNGSIWWLNK